MEYTVKALAELSGVTPRTLRWYDRLGLLKPGRLTQAGYRLYGPAEVDRLQQILFYRELGLELSAIRRLLDDPAFDREIAFPGTPIKMHGCQDAPERPAPLLGQHNEAILSGLLHKDQAEIDRLKAEKVI